MSSWDRRKALRSGSEELANLGRANSLSILTCLTYLSFVALHASPRIQCGSRRLTGAQPSACCKLSSSSARTERCRAAVPWSHSRTSRCRRRTRHRSVRRTAQPQGRNSTRPRRADHHREGGDPVHSTQSLPDPFSYRRAPTSVDKPLAAFKSRHAPRSSERAAGCCPAFGLRPPYLAPSTHGRFCGDLLNAYGWGGTLGRAETSCSGRVGLPAIGHDGGAVNALGGPPKRFDAGCWITCPH